MRKVIIIAALMAALAFLILPYFAFAGCQFIRGCQVCTWPDGSTTVNCSGGGITDGCIQGLQRNSGK